MKPAFAGIALLIACAPKPTGIIHPAKQLTFGGNRPVTISVPKQYDNAVPTPLIIVLHGYGATGFLQETYLGIDQLVDEAGVIVAAPNGTTDSTGNQFWNATDACCNFSQSTVDDVGYISSLITDISKEWNVDPKRVYLIGHSNGAFMSYRMACEKASLIAAIVALAGDTWADTSKCTPSEDVSVLDIQGTADQTISYAGGELNGVSYPGAVTSVTTWAGYDHCSGTLISSGENIDLDANLPGAETSLQNDSTCPTGIDISLWTIAGGSHLPAVTNSFRHPVWAWLNAHPKP